jgi:hypothetical protein
MCSVLLGLLNGKTALLALFRRVKALNYEELKKESPFFFNRETGLSDLK